VASKKTAVDSKKTAVTSAAAPASASGGGVEQHFHFVFMCSGAVHYSSCSAMRNPTSDATPPGSCAGPVGGLYTCTHPY